jgi:hypothetical protein
LHSFDATECFGLTSDQWMRLLAHPSMQSLRVLRSHPPKVNDASEAIVRGIAALPMLHALDVAPPRNSNPAHWCLLAAASGLTSLDIALSGDESLLPSLAAACVFDSFSSTHLGLTNPVGLNGDAFLAFFSSPGLATRLRSLRLASFWVGGLERNFIEDYASAFRLLAATLHSIHLEGIARIDWMMPHLMHATALRQIVIQPTAWRNDFNSHVPTLPTIISLLQRLPSLHCTIVLTFTREFLSARERNNLMQLQKQISSVTAAEAETRAFDHRFALHTPFEDQWLGSATGSAASSSS